MATAMATTSSNNNVVFEDQVPKSMVDALDAEDPYEALMAISRHSVQNAQRLSQQLRADLQQQYGSMELPELLHRLPNTHDMDSHPVATATACSDSILHSLTKIASGGSQASQEIKQLEQEKHDLETHAQDVETALILRRASDVAAQALSAQRYPEAAKAIQEYILHKDEWNRLTDRAKAYAGEYTVTQLDSTHRALKETLLEDYQKAVEESDVMTLGKLTPLVQMVQMEQEAVELYLRFLKAILSQQLQNAAATKEEDQEKPPYVPMARVYNAAVTILRHHLPMVSHCLHRAAGDAAVVQLVHVQVEQAVSPLFQAYIRSRQLSVCSRNAQQVYVAIEGRYSAGSRFSHDEDDEDDCGFASQVGTLADVDAAMEEAALLLQHAESYTRFIQHSVKEVNKARALRYEKQQQEKRMERERQEWATGMSSKSSSNSYDDEKDEDEPYQPLQILPAHTQLQEIVAEVGGYYSVIERCLLLASMQRAFVTPIEDDPARHLSPLGVKANLPSVGNRAVQTSVVESCLYAARRAVQRAFATGHTGTASAMTNYCADCLRGVLVEFMSRRAEDCGVTALKPGEGLLEGSAGLFNYATTQIIRQGQNVAAATSSNKKKLVDTAQKQLEIQQGITLACATLNDLQVAAKHTAELETILKGQVAKGYPSGTHETEQLEMCVSSLGPVAQVLESASKTAVESLVSVLKPRIRAIVTDAVGGDNIGAGAAGFSSVMGGAKASDRHMVRMNYDLDDEAYELLQVSEGYISRL